MQYKYLTETIITFLGVYSIFCIIILLKAYKDNMKKISNYIRGNLKSSIHKGSFYQNVSTMNHEFKKIKNFRIALLIAKPSMLIVISFLLSIMAYFVTYRVFQLKSTSIIISVSSFFLPYCILKYTIFYHKSKILKAFPTYIINLKNYTQVDNDIIVAFKRAYVDMPLKFFIDRFNVSLENGVNIYEAFERLKADINIKKINELLTALQYCHINGGNFTKLIDRYSKILMNVNLQKEKERQNSYATKIILLIIIIINIYMMFSFVFAYSEYFNIMTNTVMGIIIVNFNILSYILIVVFIVRMNKLEE